MTPADDMPARDSGAPFDAPPRRSTGRRILVGCLVAGGAFLLLVGVGVAAALWYFSRTPAQLPTARLASGESFAVLLVDRAPDDAAFNQLLDGAFDQLEQQQRAAQQAHRTRGGRAVPEWMQALDRVRSGQSRQALQQLVPRELTFVVEPGAGREAGWAVAMNPQAFPRAYSTLFSFASRNGEARQHRTHPYLLFKGKGGLALMGGTVLFASDEAMIRRAIDRLVEPSPPPPLLQKLEALGAHDARLAGRLDEDRPGGLLRRVPGCSGVTASADLVSGDEVSLVGTGECGDGASATALATSLRAALPGVSAKLARDGLSLTEPKIEVVGPRVEARAKLAGLASAVRARLQPDQPPPQDEYNSSDPAKEQEAPAAEMPADE